MSEMTLENGKYTLIRHEDGRMEALRYGEKWLDLTGDKLIAALADAIDTHLTTPPKAAVSDADIDMVAKIIADHIGHGMREKCERTAKDIVESLSGRLSQPVEDWRIGHFERTREYAQELGFNGITEALTKLDELQRAQPVVADNWHGVPNVIRQMRNCASDISKTKSLAGSWVGDTLIWFADELANLVSQPHPQAAQGGEVQEEAEDNLGRAIQALIRGDIKCSDDLPVDRRPQSVGARRGFGAVHEYMLTHSVERSELQKQIEANGNFSLSECPDLWPEWVHKAINEVAEKAERVAVPEGMDDETLCNIAENYGAEICWANEPSEFHHIITLTPPQLRSMLSAAPTLDGKEKAG